MNFTAVEDGLLDKHSWTELTEESTFLSFRFKIYQHTFCVVHVLHVSVVQL